MMEWHKTESASADYLPECLKYNEIFVQLAKGIDKGFTDLKIYAEKVVQNCSVLTADDNIISRYEKMFSLSSKGLSLEYRRKRIISQLQQRPPINDSMLKLMMSGILGNITKIEKNRNEYSLIVKYRQKTGYEDIDYAKNLLRKLVPANLMLDILYAYTEWQDVAPLLWSTVQSYTWQQLMTEDIPTE